MDPELRRQLEETYPEWVEPVERLFELHESGQGTFRKFTLQSLKESDARLYRSLHELTKAQKKTDERLAELETTKRELAEAQKRTEESLRRFIEHSGNGHGS